MQTLIALLGICLLAPCLKGECTSKFPLYLGDDQHDYHHRDDRDHHDDDHDRRDKDDERRRHHDDDDHDHDHNEHRNWRGQRSD